MAIVIAIAITVEVGPIVCHPSYGKLADGMQPLQLLHLCTSAPLRLYKLQPPRCLLVQDTAAPSQGILRESSGQLKL